MVVFINLLSSVVFHVHKLAKLEMLVVTPIGDNGIHTCL